MSKAIHKPVRAWQAVVAVLPIAAIAAVGSAIAADSNAGPARGALSTGGGPSFTVGDYRYVGHVENNPAGTQTGIRHPCPRGTIPIGGGGGGISENPGDQQVVYSNLSDGPDRNDTPDSWIVFVDNLSSVDQIASVEVICVER